MFFNYYYYYFFCSVLFSSFSSSSSLPNVEFLSFYRSLTVVVAHPFSPSFDLAFFLSPPLNYPNYYGIKNLQVLVAISLSTFKKYFLLFSFPSLQ